MAAVPPRVEHETSTWQPSRERVARRPRAAEAGIEAGMFPRMDEPVDEPFIMNVADAPTMSHPRRSTIIDFEGGEVRVWPDMGVNIQVLQPGQPNGRYHSEPVQEDFLVLHGECLVILEGEERPMRQWDFLHCPAGTAHIFVGAGTGPCAVLMIGSRRLDACHYPVSELAAKYGASAAADTDDGDEAYADWNRQPWSAAANPWPLDGPDPGES
jgi:uncharacterized cupin superfamily protein